MKGITKEHLQGAIFGLIVLVIVLIVCGSCSGSNAYFSIEQSDIKERKSTVDIVRFPDGTKVPEGYSTLIITEFITTALTLNCDYNTMIKEAEIVTAKAGGDGYRLFNVKTPDNITSWCYSCNILILKRNSS